MSRYKDIDLCAKIIKKEFSYIKSSGVSMYKKGRRDGLVLANAILNDDKRVHPADVVEVKHGEWIVDEEGFVICSECGEEHTWDEFRPLYCDMCGAKMDGERKDGE